MVSKVISKWMKGHDKDHSERTFLYIDFFCINFYQKLSSLSFSKYIYSMYNTEVASRINAFDNFVVILDTFESPLYFSRIWSLYELFVALQKGNDKIEILLPAEQ